MERFLETVSFAEVGVRKVRHVVYEIVEHGQKIHLRQLEKKSFDMSWELSRHFDVHPSNAGHRHPLYISEEQMRKLEKQGEKTKKRRFTDYTFDLWLMGAFAWINDRVIQHLLTTLSTPVCKDVLAIIRDYVGIENYACLVRRECQEPCTEFCWHIGVVGDKPYLSAVPQSNRWEDPDFVLESWTLDNLDDMTLTEE